jgi:hypothetical protein
MLYKYEYAAAGDQPEKRIIRGEEPDMAIFAAMPISTLWWASDHLGISNCKRTDASLRQRGSLTVWFTDQAITAWQAVPRTTRGGQPWYSPLAILTALTLRAVFRLALRQTEELIGSIISLPGLDLAVPDHSTLSRRAETRDVPQLGSSASMAPNLCICWWTAPG